MKSNNTSLSELFRSVSGTPKHKRSIMDFLLEDMSTDSTSVLKDRRHPSLSSINPGLKPGPKLGRVVSLNRSQSQLQPKRKNSTTQQQIVKPVVPKRTRYVSEGHYNSSQELNKMVGSRFFVCAPSDVSKSNSTLCVSLEVGMAGAPTPVPQVGDEDEREVKGTENNAGDKVFTFFFVFIFHLCPICRVVQLL